MRQKEILGLPQKVLSEVLLRPSRIQFLWDLALVPRSSSDLLLGDSVARGLTLLPRSSPVGGVAPSRSRDDAVAWGLAGVSCGLGDSLPAGDAPWPGDLLAAGEAGAAGETLPAGCEPAAPAPLVASVDTPVVLVRETPAPTSAPGLTP